MKGFVEVTLKEDGRRLFYSIREIKAIVETSAGVYIKTGVCSTGESLGICVAESYEEIKEKIRQSEV